MATVLLVRHGRTTANATGLLAGRTPGVALDDLGRDQAARTG
ncbi:histidine phosphatase, partial [Micrococcus endophyticus]